MPDETTNPTPIATDTPKPPQRETISNDDRAVLGFAGMKRQLALKEAERALAQNETAETTFAYTMLQLYMKYGLTPEKDFLDEQGNITRNKKQGEVK